MTYADLSVGIPSLLSCLEMVPISLIVVWAYPVGPYRVQSSNARQGSGNDCNRISYQGGFLGVKAFIGMMNPSDAINGTAFAVKLLMKQVPTQHGTGNYQEVHESLAMNRVERVSV